MIVIGKPELCVIRGVNIDGRLCGEVNWLKIKMSTLIYLFSVVVLLINMRYGEIFPFIPSLGNVFDVLLIVGLFLVCRLLRPINGKIHKYTRFLDLFVFSMFCLWVLELVLTVMSGRNSFVNAFSDFCQWHLKILFVYPLIYLFDYYGSAKMLKRLFSMQSIYVLTQALVAAVYNLTGRMLIPEMIRSETWLRNGNIRMTASALGCLAIVYFFSGFLSMRGGVEKKVFLFN